MVRFSYIIDTFCLFHTSLCFFFSFFTSVEWKWTEHCAGLMDFRWFIVHFLNILHIFFPALEWNVNKHTHQPLGYLGWLWIVVKWANGWRLEPENQFITNPNLIYLYHIFFLSACHEQWQKKTQRLRVKLVSLIPRINKCLEILLTVNNTLKSHWQMLWIDELP